MNVTYASYTYEHPNYLVRFPHKRRFALVASIIASRPFRRWLDYGAGDGEVYRYFEKKYRPVPAVLFEPVQRFFDQAASNLGDSSGCSLVSSLDEIDGEFDLITAFEVLEHLPLPERIRFFQFAARHLSSDGRIILEVPVEIGPVLLLKEWGRRVLKGRESDYRWDELLSASLIGKVADAQDRYNPQDTRTMIVPHHGFDIGRFVREISRLGTVVASHNSPIPSLPAWMNQCRIFEFRLNCRDSQQIESLLKED